MKKAIIKRITVICLTVITILEMVITKQISGSLLLWLFYGVYKLFT
jgi:hypothetical protein